MRIEMLAVALAVVATTPCQALAAADGPAPAKDPNEIVCRTETATGNAARRIRTCKTRAEWKKEADDAQDATRDLQDKGTINKCSGANWPC